MKEKAQEFYGVILMSGTNDITFLRLNDAKKCLKKMIDESIAAVSAQHVVVGTIPPFGSNPSFDPGKEEERQSERNAYNMWIREYAKEVGISVVEFADKMPAIDDPQFCCGDGLHYLDNGYDMMGEMIYEVIGASWN